MLTLRFLAPGFLPFVRGATTVDFGILTYRIKKYQ
jgi:hypothetical protein